MDGWLYALDLVGKVLRCRVSHVIFSFECDAGVPNSRSMGVCRGPDGVDWGGLGWIGMVSC